MRAAALALFLFAGAAAAEPAVRGVPLFETPAFHAVERRALRLAAEGAAPAARATIEAGLRRWPKAALLQADRAALLAAAGEDDAAFEALAAAVALGLEGVAGRFLAPPFDRLADDPRFAALAAAAPAAKPPAPPPPPRKIDMGAALVDESNTYWAPRVGALVARFEALPAMRRFPLIEGKLPPEMAALQRLVARGVAAGNVGDLYDNRDSDHSALIRQNARPMQMARTVYAPEAQAAGLHYGVNLSLIFDAPTIGNSSTAVTGRLARSQARLALTSPDGPDRLARAYALNQLYVYPEHRDHDPKSEKNGQGDLFPANTPFFLVSQGSSSSDRAILSGLRVILAALRPDTKALLKERGLLAPAMQSIFRRVVTGPEPGAYFTAAAHPVVFDPHRVDIAAMIDLAQSIPADGAPGQTVIALEAESGGENEGEIVAGAGPASERFFDTPVAIARLWRGPNFERRYRLSAAATADPNNRPLRFHWFVAQGDPAAIDLRPSEDGLSADLTVRWAGPAPTAARPDIESPRVDIAVIADNGVAPHAPAFFSLLLPAHQTRAYASDGRLLGIDYRRPRGDRRYADPLLWPGRDWADEFAYDEAGRLLGWSRSTGESYTAAGLLVRARDAAGRPSLAEAVVYGVEASETGGPALVERTTGRMFRYAYDGPQDRLGSPAPLD